MVERFHKRIQKDLNLCFKSQNYTLMPHSDNQHEFIMNFVSTSHFYEGQNHSINIKLKYGSGDDIYFYPINAPLCTFLTPIWHPNIDKYGSGIICMDTLKESWNTTMTIDNIYSMLMLLLSEPNPNSPQNPEAAKQFINDISLFKQHVTEYFLNNI